MKKGKKPKNELSIVLEKVLAKRLFFVGIVMIFFGSIMFIFAILTSSQSSSDIPESVEDAEVSSGFFADLDLSSSLTEKEISQAYLVSGIFSVIGTALIIISKRKKRRWDEEENFSC